MNSRNDIIHSIEVSTGLPRDMIIEILDSLTEVVRDEVARTGEFRLKNVFSVKKRTIPARRAKNVNGDGMIDMPETTAIYAKLSSTVINAYKNSKRAL